MDLQTGEIITVNKLKALVVYVGLLVVTATLVIGTSEVFSDTTQDFLMVILSVFLTIIVIDVRDSY